MSEQFNRPNASAMKGKSAVKPSILEPSPKKLSKPGISSYTLPTGICHSQEMLKHWRPDNKFVSGDDDDDTDEPERPSRLTKIMNQVSKENLTPYLEQIQVRRATREEIMLVHSEGHWNRIKETADLSLSELKDRAAYYNRLSLFVNAETFDCARLSCGGVIEMCRAVVENRIRNGFAVVRPPGHHSEPEDPSGFCVFNNAAVTAKWLRAIYPEIKRILLIDWDVHHGNGTQRSFYHDPSVLYISIHRYLEDNRTTYFYPGSDWGGSHRVGEGEGRGFNVNIPWPEGGMGDEDYIFAFQRLVMPIAMEFNPDFVIVSAGFDAAKNDPLGECNVTPTGFAHMTHMLSALANGKIVLALEGGYDLESLALSATECIKVLMGETPPQSKQGLVASDVATETVDACLKVQADFWKSIPRGLVTRNEAVVDNLNIPISSILSMHRTYDLHHNHNLCNIPLHDTNSSVLIDAYSNKIMVSDNVYDCETLVLFMHDLGDIRNDLSAQPASFNEEKDTILTSNAQVMKWISENKFGVIDVQITPATVSELADGLAQKVERRQAIKQLVQWLWNQFIILADCQNLALVFVGEGCRTLPDLLSLQGIKEKVKASVYVPSVNRIPPIQLNTSHDWYRSLSIALLSKELQKSKLNSVSPDIKLHGTLGNTEYTRPSAILRHDWPQISNFIISKLSSSSSSHTNGQTSLDGMDIDQPADGSLQTVNGTQTAS